MDNIYNKTDKLSYINSKVQTGKGRLPTATVRQQPEICVGESRASEGPEDS